MRRSVRTLIFLRAVSLPLIKVLADLKKRRDAFFYRHLGPSGPKEVPALPSEPPHPNGSHPVHPDNPGNPDSDNTKKRATGIKPMRVSLVRRNIRKGNPSSGLEALHVYSTMAREEPEGP